MTTFVTHDTTAALRRIAALPAADRDAAIRERIVAPFQSMFALMRRPGAPPADDADLAAARGWMMVPPDDAGHAYLAALDRLDAAHAPDVALEALERADAAFAAAGIDTRLETVRVGVFPFPPDSPRIAATRGYTGFGAVAGYIMMMLWPDDDTLPRLPAATVHEFNHQVRFGYLPFRMDVSVGEYIVAEGVAESFAGALYGADMIGPWVTEHAPDSLARSKGIIGQALDLRGFDTARSYIFGDPGAEQQGRSAVGLPQFAGYAVGYHLVQAYLRNTGRSAVEATVVPAADIIAGADFF